MDLVGWQFPLLISTIYLAFAFRHDRRILMINAWAWVFVTLLFVYFDYREVTTHQPQLPVERPARAI